MAATVGSLRIELSANIAQFQEDMGKAASSVKQTAAVFTAAGNDFKKIGSQLQGVGLALSKTITLPLVAISAAVFKVGTDFEDAFAGVRKTVSGSAADLDGISEAFREMAKTIPTSATELAKIGEIAGQLGVSKENVVEFTKTISQIATATHLTAEEAATSFAKLANVMHVPKDQFESLGSAVYSLGNFGASTEQEMLDMGQRIAGAGATVGLTAGQVLGLANALASVGVNAEAGGTAMSRILIKMAQAAHDGGKALDEFAKVAGKTAGEFKEQFQTDAGGAVVAFVEGLGRIKETGGDLLGTIDALGFKQQRLKDSTLLMANAGHLVAESVALGTKAFQDHTEFLGAVQERYKTTSNELKVLGNRIADVGITLFTALKPAIEAGIQLVETLLPYLDSMAKAFASLPGWVQLSVIGVAAFAAALGPAIWLSGQMVSSLAQLTLAFGKNGLATRAIIGGLGVAENALQALGSAVLVDGTLMFEWGKSTVAVGGWIGKLSATLGTLVSGGLGPLAGAFEVVGGAIAALFSPVTLVIGGFVALGLAVAAATGHWDDVKAAMGAVVQVVKDVGAGLWYLAKTVIGGLVDGLITLAQWIGSGLVAGFKELASVVVAVARPFVDFGVSVNESLNSLGGFGTVLKIAGVGLLGLVSPVAGVVAGLVLLVARWEDVKAAIGGVGQVFQDIGTVVSFFVKGALADLVTGFISLAKYLWSGLVSGFEGLLSAAQSLLAPFRDLATTVAGPVVAAFEHLAPVISDVIGWLGKAGSATASFVANSIGWLHEYAAAVRDMAKDVEAGFWQANSGWDGAAEGVQKFRQAVTDRALPTAVMDIGKAFDLLKSQLSGLDFSTNGFADLMAALKAARAELAALSSTDLARLTEAVKSGAFSMKEIEEATGLSDMALKLFQQQVRESAKELKASQSIFDDYKKRVAELTTALGEALKFDVPTDFVKRQFGTMIRDVVDDAGILGKELPKVITDAFLKITIKEGTDSLQKQFVKFGEELNKQVEKDMERVNATVIKTLGVIIEAGNSTADSAAQFSIEGLKNEIKNLEATTGETKKSYDLRKQLAAEEYQFEVTLIQRKGQADKDALDKRDENYKQALDSIDQMTAAKMGLASQAYQQKIGEMTRSTKRWTDSLGELASAFSSIASSSTGAFSDTVKEIGSVIGAFGNATKAAKDFAKATQEYQIAVDNGDTAGQYAAIGNKVAAVASGIAAVAQATSAKSVVGAVVGGAVTGAALGSVVPGVGTGVGAAAGALVGLIRALYKGPAEKAAEDVGRDFGIVISDSLAKELGDLGKRIGRQAAGVFDLDKIIAEGGGLRAGNLDAYTKKLRDTFVLVKTGALTAADGAVVLDKNFTNFANAFLANGPLISKDLVEIVRLTDDLGASSKAVGDFIKQQVTGTILPGLQAFAGASKEASAALLDNQKKLADLQDQLSKASAGPDQDKLKKDIADVTAAIAKEQGVIAATAVTSQGAANALSASVVVAFAEMMKSGTPIVDIVNQLEPVVDSLGKQFEAAGFSGGAAFDNIRSLVGLAADEIAGPAIQATTGLGQALAGLSNIGQLSQETFTGLTDQIDATFNSLIAQGKDGSQVLALMQGPLQTIWQLSTEFGYAVDDGTKALLDQALAAGVVGEKFKGPQQQMIDALAQTNSILGSIAKALGATLPDAAKQGADAVKAAFKDVNPKVKVDIQYNDPGFTPSVPGGDYNPPSFVAATGGYVTPMGVQRFDQGGTVQRLRRLFQPQGTDTVPAMLTPGEMVLNRSQQGSLAAALPSVDATGVSGTVTAGTNSAAHSIRTELPAAVDSAAGSMRETMANWSASLKQHITEALGGIGETVQTALAHPMQAVQDQFESLPAAAKDAASQISEALGRITSPTVDVALRYLKGNSPSPMPTASTGGLVTAAGVQHFAQGGTVQGFPAFAPNGTDTVPAMLTPGEMVLTKEQQARLVLALSASMPAVPSGAESSLPTSTPTDHLLSVVGAIQSGAADVVVRVTGAAPQMPAAVPSVTRSSSLRDVQRITQAAAGGWVTDRGVQWFGMGGKVQPLKEASQQGMAGASRDGSAGGWVTSVGVQHFDQGGLVQGFLSKGTDTVPAMLTPGELVLNVSQQKAIAAVLSSLGTLGDGSALTFLHAMSGALAALPAEAKVTAAAITAALDAIRPPTIQLPVEYGHPPAQPAVITLPTILIPVEYQHQPSSPGGDRATLGIPLDAGGPSHPVDHAQLGLPFGPSSSSDTARGDILGGIYPHGTMAYLQGSDGIFHDGQLADSRTSVQPMPAPDHYTINLTVHAIDSTNLREHVTKPGGIADMIIENVSQGKRGRDEKLRRGLAIV